MQFTYDSYFNLIKLIQSNGYKISGFDDASIYDYSVVLRHDVDFSLDRALIMAQKENLKGIKSTYFVMLTNDFYNVFSYHGSGILKEIRQMGREIGIHFDEQRYPDIIGKADRVISKIQEEASIISNVLEKPVKKCLCTDPVRRLLVRI